MRVIFSDFFLLQIKNQRKSVISVQSMVKYNLKGMPIICTIDKVILKSLFQSALSRNKKANFASLKALIIIQIFIIHH